MTRQAEMPIVCNTCGSEFVCSKCNRTIMTGTPFSHWFRSFQNPHELSSINFSLTDIDFVWFHYKKGWFLTIEEKRYNGELHSSQHDTQYVFYQMLKIASCSMVSTKRGFRSIEYRGHYIICFDESGPSDSNNITIIPFGNEKKGETVTVSELENFLEFGILGLSKTIKKIWQDEMNLFEIRDKIKHLFNEDIELHRLAEMI